MIKSKFEKQISTSFKSESPDILERIKSSDQFTVPEKTKKYDFSRIFNKRLSYSLASVFILALILFSALSSNTELPSVVASTVTIDINPSIQITLDDEDNVINITAINADGELLLDRDIVFKGLSLDRAIEIIIAEAVERGFIVDDTEDNIILIDVDSTRAEVQARVEAALEAKINQEVTNLNRVAQITREKRDELTEEQVDNLKNVADDLKLSVAKLLLINRIIAEDDSYTVQSLKNESIRDLYRILAQLIPDDDTIPGNFTPGNLIPGFN